MLTLRHVRTSKTSYGTFGVLHYPKGEQWIPFVLTLEDPWLNNAPFVSCIPAGTYLCKRVRSLKFGDTFEITNVPNRDHVLLHWGNSQKDTEGCVLLGEEFGSDPDGLPVIWSSKRAFDEFVRRTKDVDEFTLVITEA